MTVMGPDESERFLIESLARDDGVSVSVPESAAERWTLIRSLMNIRPPVPASDGFLDAQDNYLGRIREERGVTDADSLDYVDGIALWKGDITTLRVGAIVNAANSGMLGCFVPCHACIDNAIHSYAGIQLRLECNDIMRGRQEPTGRAVVTGAYNLPCGHVIHTVGPIVEGDVTERNEADLRSCYRSCLEAATASGIGSIAFCCVSTGVFRYPNRPAAEVAVSTVREYLSGHPGLRVVFNVFKDEDHGIYRELLGRD